MSPAVVEPVISMVKGNLDSKNINIQKLALNITVEIFNNTGDLPLNESKENDSIFVIA